MGLFWVVGGQNDETHFQETVGDREEWYGPFSDYEAARAEWAKHTWQTFDHCPTRYRIEHIDPESPPPCTD